MASPYILASSSRCLLQNIPPRSAHASVLYQRQGRAISSRDFLGHSAEKETTTKSSENARLQWHERIVSESRLNSSTRIRMQFSARQYAPCARELLRGLWSLDKDPIWLLVDQLVATGKPYDMADTCPDFPKWEHVVDARSFFEAISSLVAQGNLPLLKLEAEEENEDNDEADSNETQGDIIPTWLSMYLVSAKLDTREAAYAGVAFATSQIENTPVRLRAPLVLLTMCAVSDHGLTAQAPTVLQAFQDVFAYTEPESATTLGSKDTIIYQYNVLITLLSRFPLIPQFATYVDRLLRQMQAAGVPLDTSIATQLITPRRTAPFLVHTVREILELQQAAPSAELSVSLTRYFSKSRNRREADKYIAVARDVDPLAHAQTYLLSFRDVAASLAYLRTVETRRHRVSEGQDHPEEGSTGEPQERVGFASTLRSRLRRQVEPSQTSPAAPLNMRHIYTSMLFAAALSKSISTDTFSAMADSVRAAHGADKVLETVVLVGLLRRRAWDKARELWSAWEEKSIELRHTADETEAFFKRREQTFGDVAAVRKTLNLTEFESFLLRRSAYRMKVDNTALAVIVRAVAGSDTAGLLEAFEVMDGYAMKTTPVPSVSVNQSAAPDSGHNARFRPHDVRLTSRVVNCFLMRAFARGRLDIIFRLWDSATQYYGVEVSVPTLEVVLRSARIAASMEQSIVSVFPRWLLRGTLRDTLPVDAFHDLGDEIRWMLSPECRPGTRWNGVPAWRVARRLFREEILFANWPWLRDVPVPAHPMRGDAATSRFDALQEFAMGDNQVNGLGQYPHLVPRARTFREYVLLLSRVERSSEIPQVLAWMRALEVRPSRPMLSLCLALWAEIGMNAPIDDALEEHYTGGRLRHGGEYGRLVAWLEEWLGADQVPEDIDAMASLKYIHDLRQNDRSRTND